MSQQRLERWAVDERQLDRLALTQNVLKQLLGRLRTLFALIGSPRERNLPFGKTLGLLVHPGNVLFEANSGATGKRGQGDRG